MSEIFSRIKLSVRQVVAAVVFVVVSSLAQMFIPSLLSRMIDDGVGDGAGGRAGLVVALAIAMAALALVACELSVVSSRIAASITTKFSADLRKELFYKIQGFSAAERDKFGTASLITRNTTDVTTIQTFMTQLFGIGLLAPVTAVVA